MRLMKLLKTARGGVLVEVLSGGGVIGRAFAKGVLAGAFALVSSCLFTAGACSKRSKEAART